MINFCHKSLQPKLTCDKVCADDYDVENLISGNDHWSSQRGFRCERFISPPVSVTIHFPCNVMIAKILLDPVVGRQKSCGFEIFTCSKKVQKSWLLESNSMATVHSQSCDDVFVQVGKEIQKEAAVLCFENAAYRSRPPFNLYTDREQRVVTRSSLKHHRVTSLSAVSAVTIRIVRTVDRSAPALKRLEIWGQPAGSCDAQLQKMIFHLYTTATSNVGSEHSESQTHYMSYLPSTLPDEINNSTVNDYPCLKSCVESTSSSVPVSVDIPEEFIDPITCDIMSIPLTLPCGKSIDQLTLDKHIMAESGWGRPPSDPFTGVPFDSSQKPVPNVSLKVRIDHFLMKHASDLPTVPRTLGRAVKIKQKDESRLCESHTNGRMNLKRKLSDVHKGADKPVSKAMKCGLSDGNPSTTNSHEANLSHSLDAALYAALGSLPSFQAVKTQMSMNSENLQLSKHSCVSCYISNSDQAFYKLPCDHVVCRKCLTRTLFHSTSADCSVCGKQFMSKDVVKLNI